jgi:predicted 3-demethylubiquinone-9 3-methyltransferase (glyoxalase superfamily)
MKIETYVNVSTPERNAEGRRIRSRGTRLKVGDRIPDESTVTSFTHVHEVEPEDREVDVERYVSFKVTGPNGVVSVYKLKLDGDSFKTTDGHVIEPLSEQAAADFVRQPTNREQIERWRPAEDRGKPW